MRNVFLAGAFLSLTLSGAMFGFFYAWVCSTMWGLDTLDPDTAVSAMRAMNASVRNAVFAPAFFGTSLVLSATAAIGLRLGLKSAAVAFALGGAVYFAGAQAVTAVVNVPLNDALATAQMPEEPLAARQFWHDYSSTWQFWNQVRTVASGAALLLCGWGLYLGAGQVRSATRRLDAAQ